MGQALPACQGHDLERGCRCEVEAEVARALAVRATVDSDEVEVAGVADVEDAAAFKREIEQLNRRIAKLTGSLEATEQEIARLRTLKDVDDGVESIYRDVQGLDDSDARAEIKKELMGAIFKANMDLQGKRSTG